MECNCPGCGNKIPLDDVNVVKDIARCRRCGRTFSFSVIMAAEPSAAPDLDHPPKHLKVFREMTDYGATRVRFVYREARWPLAILFCLFMAFWSGGAALLLLRHVGEGLREDLGALLVGLPFLVGTIALIGTILVLLVGHWQLTVAGDEVTSFIGIGRFGFHHCFTRTRETRIEVDYGTTRVHNHPMRELFFRNAKAVKTFHCGVLASDEALEFLAAYLRSVRR